MSWVKDLGAHHVIDHGKPIAAQVAALGIGAPGFVFSTTHTADHLKEIVELIAPQGRLALINNEPLELSLLMRKCVSIHWESLMATCAEVTRFEDPLSPTWPLLPWPLGFWL